jgi:hypothetical protein
MARPHILAKSNRSPLKRRVKQDRAIPAPAGIHKIQDRLHLLWIRKGVLI